MTCPYKISWRGRVIFKDKDAAHQFWLTGYHRGRKAGYKLRMKDELKERKGQYEI